MEAEVTFRPLPTAGPRALLCLAIGLVASGCQRGPTLCPAEGTVSWNGSPVAHAELSFVAAGSNSVVAIAETDDRGHFEAMTGSLRGIKPGSYNVAIQKTNVADLKLPDPLPNHMSLRQYLANNIAVYPLLPTNYARADQTPFKVDIDKPIRDLQFTIEGQAPPTNILPPSATGAN